MTNYSVKIVREPFGAFSIVSRKHGARIVKTYGDGWRIGDAIHDFLAFAETA